MWIIPSDPKTMKHYHLFGPNLMGFVCSFLSLSLSPYCVNFAAPPVFIIEQNGEGWRGKEWNTRMVCNQYPTSSFSLASSLWSFQVSTTWSTFKNSNWFLATNFHHFQSILTFIPSPTDKHLKSLLSFFSFLEKEKPKES